MPAKITSSFDRRILGQAFLGAFRKLNPVSLARNPVIFVTEVGAALVTAALFVVFLAENSRVPVDDPATHLELTMIHEVMVLDSSGPDLALVELGAALKMWLLGGLVVSIVVPVRSGNPWIDLGAFVAGLLALAALVGVVESTMARLRLLRVPALLVSAGVLAALGLALMAEW